MFSTLKNAFKIKEIREKLLFTFLMLIVIRFWITAFRFLVLIEIIFLPGLKLKLEALSTSLMQFTWGPLFRKGLSCDLH